MCACHAQVIQDKLSAGIDIMKSCGGDVPVIIVGGGAGLADDDLQGASQLLRPEHAAVANAIGAAIPQVCAVHGEGLSLCHQAVMVTVLQQP